MSQVIYFLGVATATGACLLLLSRVLAELFSLPPLRVSWRPVLGFAGIWTALYLMQLLFFHFYKGQTALFGFSALGGSLLEEPLSALPMGAMATVSLFSYVLTAYLGEQTKPGMGLLLALSPLSFFAIRNLCLALLLLCVTLLYVCLQKKNAPGCVLAIAAGTLISPVMMVTCILLFGFNRWAGIGALAVSLLLTTLTMMQSGLPFVSPAGRLLTPQSLTALLQDLLFLLYLGGVPLSLYLLRNSLSFFDRLFCAVLLFVSLFLPLPPVVCSLFLLPILGVLSGKEKVVFCSGALCGVLAALDCLFGIL